MGFIVSGRRKGRGESREGSERHQLAAGGASQFLNELTRNMFTFHFCDKTVDKNLFY